MVAASGAVWDRWIATTDHSPDMVRDWIEHENGRLTRRWRELGDADLITDDDRLAGEVAQSAFDHIVVVDELPCDQTTSPAEEIDQTQFAELIAAAVENDARGQWSLMWLHSSFLARRWDAPRELFPIDEVELDDMTPSEDPELIDLPGDDAEIEVVPPIFDSVLPPAIIDEDPHPDLATSWMRTYGCQVRLVDLLIEVLLQSITVEDPQIVVVGTSGMNLGQNGCIGHGLGPLRSNDVRLPLIVSDCGPIRSHRLTPSSAFPDLVDRLAQENPAIVTPEDWTASDGEVSPCVKTESNRAELALTTSAWSFVVDEDESEHLFLKPDDVEDANDVARLRGDVIEQLKELVDR